MSTRVTRGRGRGRATANSGRNVSSSVPDDTEAGNADSAMDLDETETGNQDDSAATGLTRGTSLSRGTASGSRGVGGLLGESSEYTRRTTPGAASSSKLKFVPNMRRKIKPKIEDEDDDDVKMEEAERRTRAPRARAPRQELQMTATGAFAAGPGGAPRGFAPRAAFGPEGSGVMDASRNGIVRGRYDGDAELDPDYDSELEGGEDDEEAEQVRTASGGIKYYARELDLIGTEHEMAPTVLPKDPNVEKAANMRRKERKERRIKEEAEKVKMEDGEGTPALSSARASVELDSKEPSMIDSKEVTAEPEVKPDVKREEEGRANMRAMFDTPAGPDVSELFIFQFPRKFPKLVVADESGTALAGAVDTKVKLEDGTAAVSATAAVAAAKRSKQAPDWGRAGTRTQKAVRWSTEKGLVGQMKVHRSGRVTLTVNGDLTYEIEPAARPSFLQEVVVLDQPSKEAGADAKKTSRGIACLGQTNRKLMVMPAVDELLDKVAEQQREELRAAAALKKSVKKEKVKAE